MRQKALVRAAAVIAAAFLILLALSAALAPVEAENTAAEREAIFQTLLPGGGPYVEEPYSGEDTNISTVYRGTTGYIVETVTAGYAGDITMLVAVDFQGTVVGAVVRDMEETRYRYLAEGFVYTSLREGGGLGRSPKSEGASGRTASWIASDGTSPKLSHFLCLLEATNR